MKSGRVHLRMDESIRHIWINQNDIWVATWQYLPVCPAKTQISLGIRHVWSESLLSAWRNLASIATHWAYSEDTDQAERMRRLIWCFAFRWFCHVAAQLLLFQSIQSTPSFLQSDARIPPTHAAWLDERNMLNYSANTCWYTCINCVTYHKIHVVWTHNRVYRTVQTKCAWIKIFVSYSFQFLSPDKTVSKCKYTQTL